jgi:hypothetical protein
MDYDILFWLAIGAIYLFQAFAGRKKRRNAPGAPPVPADATGTHPGTTTEDSRRGPPGVKRRPSSDAGSRPAPASLQDALREISDVLSGRTPETAGPSGTTNMAEGASVPKRKPAPGSRTRPAATTGDMEFHSPIRRRSDSPAEKEADLAEIRKRHRTHRRKPLAEEQPVRPGLDEDVFERRSRAPRSSTYDDMFESPLYEPFGDPIEHKKLKVEILQPKSPIRKLPGGRSLTREEARRGIVLSEILGPPVSTRRRARPK